MKKFLLPLCIAFTFNVFAQNQRLYVHSNASGANNGSSWQDAFIDLQHALVAAQPGDSVWVAEGVYYPASADRSVSFRVKSGVRLFGGFEGTETTLAGRDWVTHPVVLSGAIGSIFSVDNSLHILFLENPDSNTLIDGLVFTKGVEDADTTNGGGAAIYVWAKDTVGTPVSAANIRNCRFESNASDGYGGAVHISCYGTDRTRFERCTFLQNDARFGGAAGISANEVQTVFTDCRFVANKALEGGGALTIGAWASGARFSGCHFENNRTIDSGGGAVYHKGAGLPGKGVVFSDCLFLENICAINSYPEGGAIYMQSWGGADTLAVRHCSFIRNTGDKAGGVMIDMSGAAACNFQFRHCRFEENESYAIRLGCPNGCNDNMIGSVVLDRCALLKNKGDVVSIAGIASGTQEALIRIDSCRFADNQNGRVLGVNIEGNSSVDIRHSVFNGNKNGEVLFAFAAQIFLTNCLIEENKQGYWLFSWEDGALNFRNCLFRKNQTQDFLFGVNFGALNVVNCHFDANSQVDDYPFPFFEATAAVSNSIFTGNTGAPYAIPGYLNPHFHHCHFDAPLINPPTTLTFGPGILTGPDPMFEDVVAGNFHLQPCSPLVGAGDNAATTGLPADLDGTPRIQGGTVDIGVFERNPPGLAAAPVIEEPCPGEQTGSIDFQPANGCEPYTIAWASGASTGQNLNGLAAGDYLFSITDARGSVLSLPVTIPEKTAPALAPVTTPATCGDTLGGSATLAANGAAPFTFFWPDNSTDSVRTGLASGTYVVMITDAEGCIGIDTVTITTQGRLRASVKTGKISCPGYSDGSLTVAPQNGLAPFQWIWETGDTTVSLDGLGPGLYRLTLTDALGCSVAWAIPLIEPDVDCGGETDVVFPNPFSEHLTVQTEPEPGETARWVMTDVWGRLVSSVSLSDVQMHLSFPGLPAGIYFWQIWHGAVLVDAGRIEKI